MGLKAAYSVEESVSAALQVAMKALQEVRELKRTPGPKGDPGEPGLGIDDVVVEHDGRRTFTMRMVRGDLVKELGSFVIPSVIDALVYRDTESYEKGDGVTWAGSYWIAQKDHPEKKPGEEDSGWRLAVKKGRDGRDREVVAKAEQSRDPIKLNPSRGR